MYFRQSSLNPIRLACLPSEDPPTHLKKVGYFPPLISSPLNHLRYVIASETEWNEAIAADSAITSLRYRCVRNDKYL
ncbi:hypothetical protein, partial [Nostoc sp. 'Peltigera membranacea cyanobiont' 232]|uniref:hypothetical protein n=1 Tax=Nostoc sp. 'Peltigera membranacea cyanobiont' 232 TaxID=2014531 RepID=UPI000B9F650E